MTAFPRRARAAALAVAALLAGCGGSTTPGGTTTPTILPIAASVQLDASSVSFYAYTDEDAQAIINIRQPGGQLKKFVKFKVPSGALTRRVDGTAFAPGVHDSLLITITLADPTKVDLDFQPSGLVFAAGKPAELEMEYKVVTGGDYNDDGKDDGEDTAVEQLIAVWKKETATDPFVKQGSSRDGDLGECDLEVAGFTRFALAY